MKDKTTLTTPSHVFNEDLWQGAPGMTPGEKMRNYIDICHQKVKEPFKEVTGTSAVATIPAVGQSSKIHNSLTMKKKKKKKPKTPLQEVLELSRDLQKVIDEYPKFRKTHGPASQNLSDAIVQLEAKRDHVDLSKVIKSLAEVSTLPHTKDQKMFLTLKHSKNLHEQVKRHTARTSGRYYFADKDELISVS